MKTKLSFETVKKYVDKEAFDLVCRHMLNLENKHNVLFQKWVGEL